MKLSRFREQPRFSNVDVQSTLTKGDFIPSAAIRINRSEILLPAQSDHLLQRSE